MRAAQKLWLAKALCVALGVFITALMHIALAVPAKRAPPKLKTAVRVVQRPLAATPQPAVAAPPKAVLPLNTDAPVAKRPPPRVTTPRSVPPEPVAPPTLEPDVVVAMPSAALTQPALSSPLPPPATPGPTFPQIGAPGPILDTPPGPSDIPPFQSALAGFERPGGTVTVFAVLVDDAGVVVDSQLVVPSKWPLVDMTLVFSQLGKKWTQIDPPMLTGEYRWLELRIDSALEQSRTATLP